MWLDIHAHMYKYPFPMTYDKKKDYFPLTFPNGEELVKLHDTLGIDRAVILPLVNAETYIPQSIGEVIEFCQNSNGRFIPFCNIDPRVLENTKDTDIGFLIEFYKRQGCKGMGEVLPNMAFDDPKLHNLFYHCEKAKFPLLFDCSGVKDKEYGLYDEIGMPKLRKSLEKFPNLIFIGHGPGFWAEIDELDPKQEMERWATTPLKGEGTMPKLLREYQNLWVDLSAGSGYCAMTRDIPYTKKFLNEFWDRILFGTDICYASGGQTLIKLLNELHENGDLNDEKFEAITHKNAERLLGL